MKQIIILILIGVSLSSCFQQYYKTNTTAKIEPVTFEWLQTQKKVIFVHTPAETFMLKNATFEKDNLSGEKQGVDPKYEKYMNPDANAANRYPKKRKDIVLSEVHFYTNNSFDGNGQINLPVHEMYRMDVYTKDTAATRGSKVLSIVGISATAAGIVALGVISVSEFNSSFKNMPLNINFN